jgi:hypothetical protein
MVRKGMAAALAVFLAVAGCAYVGESEITVINTTTKPVVVRDWEEHRYLIAACETRKLNLDNGRDQLGPGDEVPSDAVELWQWRPPRAFETRIIATAVITPDGVDNAPPLEPPPCAGDPPVEPSPTALRSDRSEVSPAARAPWRIWIWSDRRVVARGEASPNRPCPVVVS